MTGMLLEGHAIEHRASWLLNGYSHYSRDLLVDSWTCTVVAEIPKLVSSFEGKTHRIRLLVCREPRSGQRRLHFRS